MFHADEEGGKQSWKKWKYKTYSRSHKQNTDSTPE